MNKFNINKGKFRSLKTTLGPLAAVALATFIPLEPLMAQDLKVIPFLSTENDPASLRAFNNIFGSYNEANPDVVVDVVIASHGDMGSRIITAAAVGSDMGIMQVSSRDLTEFADLGLLMPIDDLVDQIGEENFAPGAIFRGQDGHAYAVAYTGSSFASVWVRDDLLEAAGLSQPSNYEEFLAAAEALTVDNDGDGRPDIYGFGIPGGADAATDYRFASFLYQQCADFFDWEGNVVFDRPEALEAINRYLGLFEYSPSGAVGWSWLDGIDAFIGGRIAMHPYGGRLGVNLDRTAPELREVTSVVPMNVGPIAAGSGGFDFIGIFAKARYPEVTKDVLGHFLSPDQLIEVTLTVPGHLVPPIAAVADAVLASDNPYVQKYNSDVATLFETGSTLTSDPSMNMGSVNVETCAFNPSPNPVPWAGAIFGGKPSVLSEMFQRITTDGDTPEEAWVWASTRMAEIADEWKAENPDWTPLARP